MSPRKLKRIRDSQCTGKLKHTHVLSVMFHVLSLQRDFPDQNFRGYDCDFCGALHVGHNTHPARIPTEDSIVEGMAEY